jgi:hypothetical protein
MNFIHLRLNGTLTEIYYDMIGNVPRLTKAIRDGKDILPLMDKHSLDKCKRLILKHQNL